VNLQDVVRIVHEPERSRIITSDEAGIVSSHASGSLIYIDGQISFNSADKPIGSPSMANSELFCRAMTHLYRRSRSRQSERRRLFPCYPTLTSGTPQNRVVPPPPTS
jgi:hypothetical protein